MKILLIEDNRDVSDFLKTNLLRESFTVDHTDDGAQGAYMAKVNQYDLIILDNVLPKKTGVEICREIRSLGKMTPIIFLSVNTEVRAKVEILNCGADDYLAKPFSFEELLARIRAILRRPKYITGTILTIDNLVIDTKRQQVLRGKQEIYLTRKEFALLEYLARNQGAVVSRGMIMENVWDINSDPFSNTIESHIGNLRRKLQIKKSKKLIHTVPGRGYKFDILN